MPATTVSPQKFRKILYDPATRKLGIRVDADRTINIHTIPVSQLEKWRSDESFRGSSFMRRKRLDILYNSGPEFAEDWYLIFENKSDEPVDVEYEVFER
jgi:hypothetical protein